jgi:hypothetical protein
MVKPGSFDLGYFLCLLTDVCAFGKVLECTIFLHLFVHSLRSLPSVQGVTFGS